MGIFVAALPETTNIDGGCCAPSQQLAKDFSAYYTAAWRLLHDPSEVYFRGLVSDGGPSISPQPQGYKYLPSFLLLIFPLLLLPYGSALTAFDILQFALLPLMAALLYSILRGRGLVVTSVVTAAVLVLPLPLAYSQWTLSASYYWQWAEGQCKVLETFLLLSALALARSGRPRVAGAVFALAAFDPRFAVLSAPLVLAYAKNLRAFAVCGAATFALANLALLYPPTLSGFFGMVFTSGALTPPYPYTFIPVVAVLLLLYVDRKEVVSAVRRVGRKDSSWAGRTLATHEP
ncbi:MAG TPA: glycosyltransferase 87 family protein [Nitrososphaerales archaeon]|nr:glycosyltransferase 87 family protein [Nitrososphaerales archaeon]